MDAGNTVGPGKTVGSDNAGNSDVSVRPGDKVAPGKMSPGSKEERMRELAFAGLTDDGGLLLTSGDGQQYAVPVDERLVAAVRGDRPRLGQLSIALEGATPRDIQARVRHGQSPEQVAERTGLDVQHVQRYAGPPLAERAHVAGLARQTEVRRLDGSSTLSTLVTAALEASGVTESSLEWDAWRCDDGRWTILLLWAGGDLGTDRASWTYDAAARTVTPEDDLAARLQGERPSPQAMDDEQVRRHLVGLHSVIDDASDVDLGVAPRAPWGEAPGWGTDAEVMGSRDALTTIVDRYSGEIMVDLPPGPPAEPADVPLEDLFHSTPLISRTHAKPTRRNRRRSTSREPEVGDVGEVSVETDSQTPPPATAKPARAKGRATVPSWDEILFGSKRPED
jgi:hypothetical protein